MAPPTTDHRPPTEHLVPSTEYLLNRKSARPVSAHPVHADAWRRGRGTQIQTLDRRRVVPPRRPGEKLTQIRDAAGDVAADEIGIVPFDVGRRHDRPREHALAE